MCNRNVDFCPRVFAASQLRGTKFCHPHSRKNLKCHILSRHIHVQVSRRPEDGDSMFLRNVGICLHVYTMSQRRKTIFINSTAVRISNLTFC
jgi:hypothetical protein